MLHLESWILHHERIKGAPMELLKDLTGSLFWAMALSLIPYIACSIAIGFFTKHSVSPD